MKRGSALLIVLGMAAFMMVSAISFAVYMRESRAPSSHLRRQVSSRYLLKAALANAIDRLDGQFASYRDIGNGEIGSLDNFAGGLTEGVYDDPYPGVGPSRQNSNSENERDRNYGNRNGDLWIDRVFTPFGQVGTEETVPTLTLEALAYLPPAVVNEVRISSRRTRTAQWRNLSYEFGRYAFCAVNVSDCFDLNRLSAANRRTSAAGERISMSSLFRSGRLANVNASLADQLDSILDGAGDIPFVSLADFTIAAGQTPFTPFYRYIGGSNPAFYEQGDTAALSNALFITDTWFPPTNRVGTAVKRYNLAVQQPFNSVTPNVGLMDVVQGQNQFYNDLQKHIGIIGMCCLYDYLDSDQRPLSFCIPSVETVPMVTGVGLAHGAHVRPTVEGQWLGNRQTTIFKEAETKEDGKYEYKREAVQYVLKSIADAPVQLSGTVMFPFRRAKDKDLGTGFTADALVRIWWAPRYIRGRLADASPIYPAKDDWDQPGLTVRDGFVSYCAEVNSLGLTVKDEPTTEEAMGNFNAMLELDQVSNLPLFWHIKDTTIKTPVDQDGNFGSPIVLKTENYCTLNGLAANGSKPFIGYGADGTKAGYWNDAQAQKEGPTLDGNLIKPEALDKVGNDTSVDGETYVMHIAAWVRVKKGGKVVDMAPARLSDDADNELGEVTLPEDFFGDGSPVLEFRGAKELKLAHDDTGAGGAAALTGEPEEFSNWDRLYCTDPRFNWAPENWFALNSGEGQGGNATKGEWIKKLGADGQGGGYMAANDRNHDIFMFASDQEYLQSIGELAFLPFVGWNGGGGFETYRNEFSGSFDGSSVADRVGDNYVGAGIGGNMFWRTYDPFDDPLYAMGDMEVVSGTGDFRVNPFSDDIRVLMAALANTPYDYYVASTNKSSDVNKFANADLNESLNHAFNDRGSVAKVEDDVMWDLARAMHGAFRAKALSGGFDWENAYDDLAWFDGAIGDEQLRLFGVELDDPLYGVDRKFLYSYWRECFQNRQQLFLVFIRAEPLSVGGSSGDSLANAQLGARGVALVWRDPLPPRMNRAGRDTLSNVSNWRTGGANGPRPHRTRVLFYHQFD